MKQSKKKKQQRVFLISLHLSRYQSHLKITGLLVSKARWLGYVGLWWIVLVSLCNRLLPLYSHPVQIKRYICSQVAKGWYIGLLYVYIPLYFVAFVSFFLQTHIKYFWPQSKSKKELWHQQMIQRTELEMLQILLKLVCSVSNCTD